MTNIFAQAPVYISIQEVLDSTSNTDIKNLWNDEVQSLIVRSENNINNYLWYAIPMAEITDEEVIKDFKFATFYMVESLYKDSIGSNEPQVKSEWSWDRKIEFFESADASKFMSKYGMPDNVLTILSKYKQVFYSQQI